MPKIPLYESTSRIGTAKGVTLNPNVAVRYAEAVGADDSALTLGLFNLVEETLGAGKEYLEKREKEKKIGDAHNVDLFNLQLDETYQKITEEYLKTNTRLDDNFFKTYLPQESNKYFTQFVKDKDITLTQEIQQSYDISSTNQYKTLIAATETKEANERKASGIKLATNRASRGLTKEALEVLEQVKDSYKNPVEFENQRQAIIQLGNTFEKKQIEKDKINQRRILTGLIYQNTDANLKDINNYLNGAELTSLNNELFHNGFGVDDSTLRTMVGEIEKTVSDNQIEFFQQTILNPEFNNLPLNDKIKSLITLEKIDLIPSDKLISEIRRLEEAPAFNVTEMAELLNAEQDVFANTTGNYTDIFNKYENLIRSDEGKKRLMNFILEKDNPTKSLRTTSYLDTKNIFISSLQKLATDEDLVKTDRKWRDRFKKSFKGEEVTDAEIVVLNQAAITEFKNNFDEWRKQNQEASNEEIKSEGQRIYNEIIKKYAQDENLFITQELARLTQENRQKDVDVQSELQQSNNINETEINEEILPENITEEDINRAREYFLNKKPPVFYNKKELILKIQETKNKSK